jgi:hypothetical protein
LVFRCEQHGRCVCGLYEVVVLRSQGGLVLLPPI